MKLEVGMYVRTKYGYIAKITKINPSSIYFDSQIFYASNFCAAHNKILRKENIEKIAKANYDIKKLLKVGDIIDYEYPTALGLERWYKVKVTEHLLNVLQNGENNHEYHVFSVLTKEFFERMAYKVVE